MAIICWLLLSVNGCATLDKNECLNANWEAIGYKDGHDGYSRARIDQHRKACAEYKVSPDLDTYLKGYEQGVRLFCEPQRGYQRGLNGYTYKDVCPKEMRRHYHAAYTEGRHIYDIEREIDKHHKALKALDQDLSDLEQQRKDAEASLIKGHIPRSERARLVELIRDLDTKKQDMLDDIKHHEDEIAGLEEELRDFRRRGRFR